MQTLQKHDKIQLGCLILSDENFVERSYFTVAVVSVDYYYIWGCLHNTVSGVLLETWPAEKAVNVLYYYSIQLLERNQIPSLGAKSHIE